MSHYICSSNHDHHFSDYGDGFCELCGATLVEQADPGSDMATFLPSRSIGLGLSMIDVTGSTNWGVIKGQPKPSRREVFARSMADSIMDLAHGEYKLSQPENAYVAVGLFDERAEIILLDSIVNLGKRFDSTSLREFILKEASGFNGRTDITTALKLARQVGLAAKNGDLSLWGGPKNFTLMHQNLPDEEGLDVKSIENFRCVLLTDGGHNCGDLGKPDFGMGADPLIGAYWGSTRASGAHKLGSILADCPVHGQKQWFCMERPEDNLLLRGLFRMASGTGGFCPACLKQARLDYQMNAEEAYA